MDLPIALAIIGAQKAGTTSLYGYLRQHPSLCAHDQAEMVYFLSEVEHALGPAAALRKYFPRARAGQPLLVKHAMLLYDADGLARLAAEAPGAHISVVLREPAERASSAYQYARRRGIETLPTLHEALAAETERLERDGWTRWRECAYRWNGLYARHLRQVYATCGRERVSVSLLEDLKADPVAVCQALCAQAGLAGDFLPATDVVHNVATRARSETAARWIDRLLRSKHPLKRGLARWAPPALATRARRVLLNMNKASAPAAPAEDLSELRASFRDANAELAEMLGRSLDAWNR